jgi:hypothetical protein
MVYTVVQRSEVATIMVDIMRTMIDELAFVRPYALTSELFVTDGHKQVCEVSLIATWLTEAYHDRANFLTTSRVESITFLF